MKFTLDGLLSATADRKLFAGESQWCAVAAFEPAQARFLAHDVVARDRNHTLSFRQLKLEHHHVLFAEAHFRRRQIEFPHAHETRIIEPLNLFAMREETLTPDL